jgi:hypothetical protein
MLVASFFFDQEMGISKSSEIYVILHSPWGCKWATVFLGEINMGTWPSRFGESQMKEKNMVVSFLWALDPRATALARPRSNCRSKL